MVSLLPEACIFARGRSLQTRIEAEYSKIKLSGRGYVHSCKSSKQNVRDTHGNELIAKIRLIASSIKRVLHLMKIVLFTGA